MSLSAEGQHLLDALEAHFAAIRAFAADTSDEVRDHVEAAWEDVLAELEPLEAKFRAAVGKRSETDAAAGVSTGVAGAAEGSAAGAADPSLGTLSNIAGSGKTASGIANDLNGETDIGKLVSENTAASGDDDAANSAADTPRA